MDILKSKFKKIRIHAEKYYKSVGSIKCPYFDSERVYFNSDGFEHLRFKNRFTPRRRTEQYTRFRLLPLAIETIKKSGTLQEYEERILPLKHKGLRLTKYYVFIALINNLRIKVIIKEVGGGKKHFWSVYPIWKIIKDSTGENKRKLYFGEAETD